MEQENLRTHWALSGKVIGGAWKAAYFTQLDWVQEPCYANWVSDFTPGPSLLKLQIK